MIVKRVSRIFIFLWELKTRKDIKINLNQLCKSYVMNEPYSKTHIYTPHLNIFKQILTITLFVRAIIHTQRVGNIHSMDRLHQHCQH